MSISAWLHQLDFSYLLTLLLSAAAALLCITVHESAHGLIAAALGDPTAKRAGRISLNPFQHVDFLGLVMLAVAHVGWAKPVPVDMRNFKNPKAGMALTALAGPVSNLLFGFLALCGYYFCLRYGQGEAAVYLGLFLQDLAVINCGLAVFNVIPISPLDGSKVLFAFLPQRAYSWLMRYERYGMLLLILLVVLGCLDGFLNTGLQWVVQGMWRGVAGLFSGL